MEMSFSPSLYLALPLSDAVTLLLEETGEEKSAICYKMTAKKRLGQKRPTSRTPLVVISFSPGGGAEISKLHAI